MELLLTITANEKKSLINFLEILQHFHYSRFNIFKLVCSTNLPKKKKLFSVLKSPHVNKTAQEQFYLYSYKKSVKIKSKKVFNLLVFLKTLIQQIPDVKVAVKVLIKEDKTCILNSLNPTNFFVPRKISPFHYVVLFDVYGEASFLRSFLYKDQV